MNLDQIRAKLAQMNKTGEREKVDYEKIFWRPALGKHVIRIVPSAVNPEYPFTELKFHYKIGKFPMMALSNFGEQDPVETFCAELRKRSTEKEDWKLAGTLSPQTRIFAPVIVRGEEDKGVRLWSFGSTVYKALLALAGDEEVGDFTDIENGRDLTVEIVKGAQYNETSVRIKLKQTPLSDDAKKVETWLKDQPNPIEVYTKYDYDFIKTQLQKYLDPDTEETDTSVVEGVTPDQSSRSKVASEAGLPLEDEDDLPIVGKGKPAEEKAFKITKTPVEKPVSKAKSFDALFED